MLRMLAISLFAACALSAPISADAEPAPEAIKMIGPVVGEMAPSLDGTEAVGASTAFETEGDNGIALVFVRSADWCPYCKTQLIELNAAVAPLSQAGWRLGAISYDSPAILEAFAAEQALDFVLMSDPQSEAISAFGLLNEDMKPASRAYGIPHPAVVFIRTDGTVAAVLREDGYKTRPSVTAIVETANLLNAAASPDS